MHSSRRKDDIETKARLSAFKAKRRNDYEDRLLSLHLQQLHNQTVNSLAEHWKSTMEVVNIFKGCHRTSGTSPLGIIPEDNGIRGCVNDVPGRTTPWTYFGRFSIDSWYKPEEERFKRPQTVGSCFRTAKRDKPRPNTAPELNSCDTGANKCSVLQESLRKKDLKRDQSDQTRRTQVIQIQAKAMTMTRSKFLDLENVGPMYNRNLAAVLKKRPDMRDCEHSQLNFPDSENPKETRRDNNLDVRVGPSYRGLHPTSEEAWDLNCMRNHMQVYGISSNRSEKLTNSDKKTETIESSAAVQKMKIRKKLAELSEEYPADEHRQIGVHWTRRRRSPKRPKSHPDLREVPKPGDTDTKREQERKDSKEYADMISRLTRQPLTHSKSFKASKFYIRPQERYKMEQQFLMKRYFLLQRQMNKNHDVEASILAKAQTAIVVMPNSSKSARLKMLAALTEQNTTQKKTKCRYDDVEAMRNKVQAFLDSVAEFVKRTMPEESHIAIPSQEEPVNVPKLTGPD